MGPDMSRTLTKICEKMEDHMLLGSIYDRIMIKTKYRQDPLAFNYNVMIGQKHRMLQFKKLRSAYLKRCTAERPWEQCAKQQNPDTVWVMWYQGLEQAPLLVRRCFSSLQKNMEAKKIIFLDKDNLFDYISLPDFIMEKYEKGILSNAHFSDLVRLELLIRYGGWWIDSTVFCTDAGIMDKLKDTSLFMYSFYYFGFNPEIMETNNWLIYSETNNNILCLEQKLLYTYWKEKNRPVDYFLFHLFMTMALQFYKEEYEKMPVVSQVDAHVLATYMEQPFCSSKYEILKDSTGFHKLSTRFEERILNEKGNFYDVVIRQGEKDA